MNGHRSSVKAFRGPGLKEGLRFWQDKRGFEADDFDRHSEASQAAPAAEC